MAKSYFPETRESKIQTGTSKYIIIQIIFSGQQKIITAGR
jgi:hypothetical protein